MKVISLLLALFVGVSQAHADEATWSYVSKTSVDFKGFSNNKGDGAGWLAGLRFARFIDETPFYLDIGVDFGKASSIDQSDFSMVGLGLGAEKVFDRYLVGARADFDLLSEDIGPQTNSYAGYDLEAYAGIVLGHGWRFDLTGGYVHTFLQQYYTGLTFGLKIEYKAERTITSKPIDN